MREDEYKTIEKVDNHMPYLRIVANIQEWDGTKSGTVKGHHTILVSIHPLFASAITISGSSALRRALGLSEEQERFDFSIQTNNLFFCSASSNYYLTEPDFTFHLHNDAAFLVNSA
jgi:hypothetical protein